MTERLTDDQVKALIRWATVLAMPQLTELQAHRIADCAADLRDTRAELETLRAARSFLLEIVMAYRCHTVADYDKQNAHYRERAAAILASPALPHEQEDQ